MRRVTDLTPARRGRPPAGGREAILAAALTLLRDRGIGRLTTREVAVIAGVSEASVFYHYRDRAGLLKAVLEKGLEPLKALNLEGMPAGDRRRVLRTMGDAIERFLEQALPAMTAAQSDVALRDELADYMREQDMGAHRGVQALGGYLAAEQRDGRVRRDVDPEAVAAAFVATCFTRASHQQMRLDVAALPSLEAVIDALDTMLEPVGAER